MTLHAILRTRSVNRVSFYLPLLFGEQADRFRRSQIEPRKVRGVVRSEGGVGLAMIDGNLSREQIRRRILDNLRWGNMPYHVIEPLPPVVIPPPRASIPVSLVPTVQVRSRSLGKRVVKRLITSVPFLGRAALVLLMPLLWSLSVTGTLATRLQSITRRIDNLIQ